MPNIFFSHLCCSHHNNYDIFLDETDVMRPPPLASSNLKPYSLRTEYKKEEITSKKRNESSSDESSKIIKNYSHFHLVNHLPNR